MDFFFFFLKRQIKIVFLSFVELLLLIYIFGVGLRHWLITCTNVCFTETRGTVQKENETNNGLI